MAWTRQKVKDAVLDLGYAWFEEGNYNLNIVGIRNSLTSNEVTNKFDDWLTVSYNVDGEEFYHEFGATCDPGMHWMENLLNPNGAAILVPGQYRGSHQIGLHRGQYEALVQKNPVKVFRDNNRDDRYDMNPRRIKEGLFGINIHRATRIAEGESKLVDKWSAGCQVIARNANFVLFMELCNQAKNIWGNSFTYTLLESNKLMHMDYLKFQEKQSL